jgi:hypothetical protein
MENDKDERIENIKLHLSAGLNRNLSVISTTHSNGCPLLAKHKRSSQHADQAGKENFDAAILRGFANIATNAWRAKGKMINENGETKEEMKRVYRHVESIYHSLEEMGVKIIDPSDSNYDAGMALKVISSEKTPGYLKDRIKETIKPTITFDGCLIQIGEVIVGTPQ